MRARARNQPELLHSVWKRRRLVGCVGSAPRGNRSLSARLGCRIDASTVRNASSLPEPIRDGFRKDAARRVPVEEEKHVVDVVAHFHSSSPIVLVRMSTTPKAIRIHFSFGTRFAHRTIVTRLGRPV